MQEPKEETVKPRKTRNKAPVKFEDFTVSIKNLKTVGERNSDTTFSENHSVSKESSQQEESKRPITQEKKDPQKEQNSVGRKLGIQTESNKVEMSIELRDRIA